MGMMRLSFCSYERGDIATAWGALSLSLSLTMGMRRPKSRSHGWKRREVPNDLSHTRAHAFGSSKRGEPAIGGICNIVSPELALGGTRLPRR